MIEKLKLKFGRSPGAPFAEFTVAPVTVFVGPNNSGKSQILAEILDHLKAKSTVGGSSGVILDELFYSPLSETAFEDAIARIAKKSIKGKPDSPNQVRIGSTSGENAVFDKAMLKEYLSMRDSSRVDPAKQTFLRQHFAQMRGHPILRFSHLLLNGITRMSVAMPQSAGNLQNQPTTTLQTLFQDDDLRAEVRRIIYDAFGLYFVIDPTTLGQLQVRFSQRQPASILEERGIHQEAIAFHAEAEPVAKTSDGVKAFTTIITQVVAGDPFILLIDEPEAFLHPTLAFKLGSELARAAYHAPYKRIFVSTHNASFVMGCISSGTPVTIVRLTNRNNAPTARVLSSDELTQLMRNPLLRSTGVINALFYESVVVTEADTDRAFYEEINERLLRYKPAWGIPNCLFINARNKQTVPTIVEPLRKMGIPTVGIVDIDVVKDGGAVGTNLLSKAGIPQMMHQGLAATRTALKEAMTRTGRDMKREGGLNILDHAEREAAENYFEQLANYGVFVVPSGELESWLKPLGVSGHGPEWLAAVFEKMGDNPSSSDYLRPGDDDVWQFIAKIRSWLFEPKRRGIPQ